MSTPRRRMHERRAVSVLEEPDADNPALIVTEMKTVLVSNKLWLKSDEVARPHKFIDILFRFDKHCCMWPSMQRIRTILQLLLSDERSAVGRWTAMLTSFVILATVVLGLVLMSLGDQTYRSLDRRVLIAACESFAGRLI